MEYFSKFKIFHVNIYFEKYNIQPNLAIPNMYSTLKLAKSKYLANSKVMVLENPS
jgi:hypothetical protein